MRDTREAGSSRRCPRGIGEPASMTIAEPEMERRILRHRGAEFEEKEGDRPLRADPPVIHRTLEAPPSTTSWWPLT